MPYLAPRQLAVHLGGWREPSAGAAYLALADRIRLLVLDGRVAIGTRLPAERELAAELGVSRTTVTGAYARLRDLGYLDSRRGSGSLARLPVSGAPGGAGEPEPLEGIADFSRATLPTWPGVADAAVRAAERLPAYLGESGFDAVGYLGLREAIAAQYGSRGLPTDPDQIVVTLGAQHAIALVARTVLGRGDRALVENPTYPHALDALRAAGGRLVSVGVSTEDGWDPAGFAAAFSSAAPALAYLMPDSHNPTGRSMPASQRDRVAALAARAGTVLVVDETMRGLDLTGGAGHPPFATLGPHVVTIGSVGKSVWGGLRIGWIRGSREFAQRVVRARFANDLGTPMLEQLIVAELMPDLERILAARRAVLRENRDHVVTQLRRRMPEWHVPLPDGGLTVWVNLGRPLSSALALRAREGGLLIASGQRFGQGGAFERFLRVPFSLRRAELDAGLDALEQAWAAVLRRPSAGADESYAQIA
ncbi:MAG: PLP-dependent aminotransferase family protein [Micrococcales bacterium]|nr:PLP-dependent aminotransferase family protein [Micrococcales bacterium]